MKFLKNIPLHALLIAPLIIFFLLVHNFREVNVEDISRSLFLSFSFSLTAFFLLFFLFKKNQHKAGIFLSALFLFLFSYGWVYDHLENLYFKGLWPFLNIHRYLLLGIGIANLSLFIYIYRAKRAFYAFTFPMNLFVLTLVLLNSFKLIRNYEPALITVQAESIVKKKPSSAYPDIYYIILDGYANDKVLADFYNYSRNPLTEFLREKGFFVASESRTNYPATQESLSSSLNFNYLDSLKNGGENLIYRNKACSYLKEKGYKIVHMRSGYTVTRYNYLADTTLTLDNISEFERALLRLTIFRLDELAGYLHYKTLKNQMEKIFLLPSVEGPKFAFVHIVSPHPPFTCNEEGAFQLGSSLTHAWWEPKDDYLGQLKYVNASIQKFILKLLENPDKQPVIIMQSDHGPWMQNPEEKNIHEARSRILNAYYFPPSYPAPVYSGITPVNTFRITLNTLFRDTLPLLKDIPLSPEQLKASEFFKNMHQ